MSKLIFPQGRSIFGKKSYSKEFLEITISEIRDAGEFTGFLKLEADHAQSLLFFLRGRPYAAGKIEGQRPFSQTIRGLFEDLPKGDKVNAVLSLHEADPALLKGLLVYLQREPSVKASTDLINFDDILGEIEKNAAGALVVLKRGDAMNFFFFFGGLPVISHYALPGDETGTSLPVMEQLLQYAYPSDAAPVDVLIYFDISTSQASDAEDISESELFLMEDCKVRQAQAAVCSRVVISVISGPDMDKRFTVDLPCKIGRKEGDIVLRDKMVSGSHAVLRESGGKLLIEDFHSTNGTYVDGVGVEMKELLGGEVITVGETRLRVETITFTGHECQ